ncbi:hypothetical protein AY599_16350 [Leptolyngbya valderiana BDU 20041]|nr:hypothetical protein AY599_16350 [Leptolyngbya valderiana BDU 20041]
MPNAATAAAIRPRTPLALLAAVGLCLTATAPAAHAQSTIEWASPVDGDFSVAGNWLPMMVPGAMDTAVLGGVGAYEVRVGGSRELAMADLSNARASIQISRGRTLTLGGLRGGGEIIVGDGMSVTSFTTLRTRDGAELDGVVRLNGQAATFARLEDTSGQVRLAPGGVLTGQGRLISDLDGGTIRAEADRTVSLTGRRITNAIIESVGGEFSTDGGTVFEHATLRGTYQVPAGASLVLGPNVRIGDGIIVGDGMSVTSFTTLRTRDGAELDGVVRLNGQAATFARLEDTSGQVRLAPGGVITGQGTLLGEHVLAGTLSPGAGDDGVGLIAPFEATVALTPTATLALDIGGTDPAAHDRIAGSGTITLGGSLEVGFVDGYVPAGRDRFEIVRATSIDGAFATTTIEPVGPIGPAHIVSHGDAVILVICAADRDADGELTIFDFLAFQNLFDAGDLRADLDEDGQLTIFDFLTYQNRFAAGCG